MDATSRIFAPLNGINAEAATGMAAGPLGYYLYDNGIGKATINIQQGELMKIPSISLIKVLLTIEDNK